VTTWQRARRPEQKEQRLRAIVDAAAALFAESSYDQVSMSAIAERAGQAKGNLYRYFSTKEEIFLRLYLDEVDGWVEALERALAPLAGGDEPARVAAVITRVTATRPRLCSLLALLTGVLERNVTVEAVSAFKEQLAAEAQPRVIAALRGALPSLDEQRAALLLRYLHALAASLWQMANPAPVLAEVLERPHLRPLRVDFELDLGRALTALIDGLMP